MQEWNDSVKRLILGSDAQDAPLSASSPELSDILDRMVKETGERRLLKTAAIYHFARVVGQPREQQFVIREAPQETRRHCSSKSEELLRWSLRNKDYRLLEEYLSGLADKELLLTPVILAEIIASSFTHTRLQPKVRQVLGDRGEWLCAMNPDWESLLGKVSADAEIAELTGMYKVEAFKRLRQTDPAEALRQILSGWKDEAAKERLMIMESMAVGLSPDDIPFLLECERDRSQSVRYQASRFLMRLKEESMQRALHSWLGSCLTLKKSLLKKTQLIIDLPKTFEKEWEKWGIKEDLGHIPNRTKVGKRAGWFYQVLALVSPKVSAGILQLSLEQTIELYRRSDYAEAAMQALSEGATLHGEAEYFELLFPMLSEDERIEYVGNLCTGFSEAQMEPIILPVIKNETKKSSKYWLPLLYQIKSLQSFSPGVSEAVVEMLRAKFLSGESWYHDTQQSINQLAYQFSLAPCDKICTLLESIQDDRINPLLTVYRRRVEFHKELQL